VTQQRTFRLSQFRRLKRPTVHPHCPHLLRRPSPDHGPDSGASQVHLEGSCQYTPNGSTGSAPGAPGGMLLTVVDDMVVDLGRFSCMSRLAAWQQPIDS